MILDTGVILPYKPNGGSSGGGGSIHMEIDTTHETNIYQAKIIWKHKWPFTKFNDWHYF